MSLELVIAGYAFCILAALLGTAALVSSGHGSRKLRWLLAGQASILLALALFALRTRLPAFFGSILPNLALLFAFVLFHQAVAEIIESSRRYLGASISLLGAQLVAYWVFTFTVPDLRARIIARSVALLVQCALTVSILLRGRKRPYHDASRVAAWIFSCLFLLEFSRICASLVWTPSFTAQSLDPVQALYTNFGFSLGFAAVLSIIWIDLSAQRENLHRMATIDGLSGLMNRRTFDQVLQRELDYAERWGEPIALLMIDVDHFKAINDRYGHPMGDEVIRRISRLLLINTRAMDAVARYGGEEFAMILRGMDLSQAQSIAERLRTQIEAMAGLPEPLRVTASIGITTACPGDTVASLIKRSDRALYDSKHSGRNRVCAQLACTEY